MKTYVADMVIKLKLGDFASLTTTGKLVGIHKSKPKEAKTKLLAPGTTEQVRQFYIPESLVGQDVKADQLLTRDMCDNGVVIKDVINSTTAVTVVDSEAFAAVQESALPKNVMNVTVHTRADVDEAMFKAPEGQSFVFYPDLKDPDNVQNYNLLAAVLTNSNLAFCSIVNLQNHEGLFRLDMWRDRIILVKQGFTDQINEHKPPAEGEFDVAPIPEKVIEKAIKGFGKMVEPIDPATYRDRMTEEKVALKVAADNGEVVVKPEPVKGPSALDALMDLFGDN